MDPLARKVSVASSRRSPLARTISLGAWLLAGLAAPGCVHYHALPIAPDRNLLALESRRLDDPEVTRFLKAHSPETVWPPPAWDLQALTIAAFYYNPDLDVARGNWAAAQAAAVAAGDRPNPNAGVEVGYNSTTPQSLVTPWILSLPLDITVETAGKRGHRVAAARNLSEVARLNVAAVAWQVRSRVRKALLDLHAAAGTVTLLEQQVEIQQENLALIQRQLAAGAISAFEMAQARLALNSARLALHDFHRRRAEARIQLAAALGVTAQALDGVTFSFEVFERPPADLLAPSLRRQALLNRADVLGALAEYEASQARLQLEVARQYPDLHLGLGYQMDQAENKWTLGLSGLLPIFNRNRGAIAESEARRAEAAARFTAIQSRAIEETAVAVEGWEAARAKRATAEALLEDLRKEAPVADARWRAGEISKLELDTLRLEIASSELARFTALVEVQEALGRLEDAMQSPSDLPAWTSLTLPRATAKEGNR